MTTIVYRDGILAADRQMSQNDLVHPCDCKIVVAKAKNGDALAAIAFAGHTTLGLAFVKWIEEGKPDKFPASFDSKGYFYALLVYPAPVNDRDAKPIVEYWDAQLFSLDETANAYSAQGAGSLIAIGALYQGATAIEAIRAANYHSPDSGFGVLYIDLTDINGLDVKRASIVRVE